MFRTDSIYKPIGQGYGWTLLVEECFVQSDNDYQGRTCLVHHAEDEEGHLVGRAGQLEQLQ